MPELPEVEAIRRQLEPHLLNQKIIGFDWILPRILREGDSAALVGAQILSVQRRGKHLIIETDKPDAMFIHLRMTGTLLWGSTTLADRFLRARILLSNGVAFYRDIRTLGGIWIRPLASPPWKSLALDPLEAGFDTGYLVGQLAKRHISIKQALLDQSIIAGIGNIYASEILFRAGIHPSTIASRLGLAQVNKIAEFSNLILREAIAASGTTFRDFRLTDGREGAFQDFLRVYGKNGKPCQTCGELIQRIVQGQRSTYFCPCCQSSTA